MYRLLNELLQPYALLFLIALAAVINLWRRRRETRARLLLVTVPLVLLLLLSTPAISHLAFGTLEWRFSPRVELPPDCQALVVLAGGLLPKDKYRPVSHLAETTVDRGLYAAELYRRSGPCLVVLSGRSGEEDEGQQPVSVLMKEFLVKQGVAVNDLLIEARSDSTYENASECRNLLEPRGIRRVALVTAASHMLRAKRCFEKCSFEVTPAPCDFKTSEFELRPVTFLPSPGAASGTLGVFHEWVGLCWYWLQGRV